MCELYKSVLIRSYSKYEQVPYKSVRVCVLDRMGVTQCRRTRHHSHHLLQAVPASAALHTNGLRHQERLLQESVHL